MRGRDLHESATCKDHQCVCLSSVTRGANPSALTTVILYAVICGLDELP